MLNMGKCGKNLYGDIYEENLYYFVGERWDAKVLNVMFTSPSGLQKRLKVNIAKSE